MPTTYTTTGQATIIDDVATFGQDTVGRATLTEINDNRHDFNVWLVTPDGNLAAHYGVHHHADRVIGGLFRTAAGWQITAYTDRDHAHNNQGLVYNLPTARSRAAAVRALLRWWWLVSRAENPTQQATMDPFALSRSDQRALVR